MTDDRQAALTDPLGLLSVFPGLSAANRAETLETLYKNATTNVRQVALRVGATFLSDEQIIAYLRNGSDDVMRNAASEMLKFKGLRSFPLLLALLRDEDPDIVLQAVLVMDHLRNPRSLEPLRQLLRHHNTNIVQAAIIALGHLGDLRIVPDLLSFLQADPWLQMAAVQALGDLHSDQSLTILKSLLSDSFLGPLATEAVGRIGGAAAFQILAAHWIPYIDVLDEDSLTLLAHVAEGLSERPDPGSMADAFACRLEDGKKGIRKAAARCILALGPGKHDKKALEILAEDSSDSLPPSCISRRSDLIALLLDNPGAMRTWGLELASRCQASIPPEVVSRVINDPEFFLFADILPIVFMNQNDPNLAGAVIDLYAKLPLIQRPELYPVLQRYRESLLKELPDHPALDPQTKRGLSILLKYACDEMPQQINDLPMEDRILLVSHLMGDALTLKQLPLNEWLGGSPEVFGPMVAEIARLHQMKELLPALRKLLTTHPIPEVIRALGDLKDNDSVSALSHCVNEGVTYEEALALEAIGKIGGAEARDCLRMWIGGTQLKEKRFAYRALAQCCTQQEEPIFREAATHNDWVIRLACTEVLSRFSSAENLSVLIRLSADPVLIVAQRAQASLESRTE